MSNTEAKPENRKSVVLTCRVDAVSGLPDRTIRFLASTPGIASDGGIIEANAWAFDRYLKNPVVLWGHEHHEIGIGKVTRIVQAADGLEMDVLFAGPDEANPKAETVFRMVKNGFTNACSVGFDVLESRSATDEEKAAGCFWVATKVSLYELSIVNVGADADALVLARAVRSGDLRKEDSATARNMLGLHIVAERIDSAIALKESEEAVAGLRAAMAENLAQVEKTRAALEGLVQISKAVLAATIVAAREDKKRDAAPGVCCPNCGCGMNYCQECGTVLEAPSVAKAAESPSQRKDEIKPEAPVSEASGDAQSGLEATPKTPEDEAWLIAELDARLKVSHSNVQGSH